MPEDVSQRVRCGAYHEAGHIIAAVQGLRLSPEGLMVDLSGEGLACYCKEVEGSDLLRERVIVATLTGFRAEERFRQESSYPARSKPEFIFGPDGREARGLLMKLPGEYFSNERVLEDRVDHLIDQNWHAIKVLATALLAKDPEPLKPLKSGATWSHQKSARYLAGEEVVRMLGRCGIVAACDADC
jgi:hypothetical protein